MSLNLVIKLDNGVDIVVDVGGWLHEVFHVLAHELDGVEGGLDLALLEGMRMVV